MKLPSEDEPKRRISYARNELNIGSFNHLYLSHPHLFTKRP